MPLSQDTTLSRLLTSHTTSSLIGWQSDLQTHHSGMRLNFKCSVKVENASGARFWAANVQLSMPLIMRKQPENMRIYLSDTPVRHTHQLPANESERSRTQNHLSVLTQCAQQRQCFSSVIQCYRRRHRTSDRFHGNVRLSRLKETSAGNDTEKTNKQQMTHFTSKLPNFFFSLPLNQIFEHESW